MDPVTVIALLAVQLACTGGLLYLVGLRSTVQAGLRPWAAGLALSGVAGALRLLTGEPAPPAWAPLADATIVGAALFVIAGLRDFVARPPLSRGLGALLLLGAAAVEILALDAFGAAGRDAALRLVLGTLVAWLAVDAAQALQRAEPALRPPLALLAALASGLALLTLARGLQLIGAGAAPAWDGIVALAAVLLALDLLWLVFARLNGQLAELATRDALTRLLNRSGLDEALTRHFGARDAPALTLLAIDADHFKRVNDRLGRAAGDRVLRALAATLKRHLRPSDLVARVGGDEFVICCAGADAAGARALAERLRDAARSLDLAAADSRGDVGCSISIGVSRPFRALADWPRAAGEADRALYAAKAAGCDRVCTA
jgi:diguanylate cyclase (GGDEF)-like protein